MSRLEWTIIAAIVAYVLTLIVIVSSANAHDFYPWECCSGYDCGPLELAQVPVEKDGGWTLWDGRRVPYGDKRIKASPDGKYHLCERKYPENTAEREILCFYTPGGGV